MATQKIRKGDTVVILSGKDKGRTGEVTKSMPKDGKVVVSGVNVAIRHRKPSQTNPQGGLERREAPMHVSKVAVADPKSGKATRPWIRASALHDVPGHPAGWSGSACDDAPRH